MAGPSGLFGAQLRHLEYGSAMLTEGPALSLLRWTLTIYRADLQQSIATGLVATGRYYWTNVYYFVANNSTEFDLGRDQCSECQSRAFCDDVSSDRILITEVGSGSVVQHGIFHWVPLGAWGSSDSPITNCVLVWLYSGGVKVGYKRYRVPVPMSAMSGGLLTATFLSDYLVDGPGNALIGGQVSTINGAFIDAAVVDPRVSQWQIRHGTKRAERRAV